MASVSLFDGAGRRVGFTETRSNGNIVAYLPKLLIDTRLQSRPPFAFARH